MNVNLSPLDIEYDLALTPEALDTSATALTSATMDVTPITPPVLRLPCDFRIVMLPPCFASSVTPMNVEFAGATRASGR